MAAEIHCSRFYVILPGYIEDKSFVWYNNQNYCKKADMKHLEVVAGIIEYQDKILCMQRNVSKFEYTSLKFEFPGGKIEPGETPEEALRRELVEEMDMKVGEVEYFYTVNHEYPDFSITMQSFICKVEKPDFIMKEHKSFKWLKKEDLLSLDWAAADMPIVKELMK